MTTEPPATASASTSDREWRPLLTGQDAERARTAIRAVADELRAPGASVLERVPEARRPSLAGGDSGFGLFYAYLALGSEDEAEADAWADEALGYLDRAADALSAAVTPPELYSGFTGVAWCLEHLDGLLFENEGDGQAGIDEVLLEFLDSRPAALEFDVIQGLSGYGLYALERGDRPSAVACLEKVIQRLGETATRDEDGVRWFSPPERLPDHQRAEYPEGYFNAGTAHGLPGVLPVLAGAAAVGVAEAEARELLEGGVHWLLTHRLDSPEDTPGCHLPYSWTPDGDCNRMRTVRLAWCYGDPGAAAALYASARQVGRDDWAEEAVRIAVDSAERPYDESGIQDAGLCHGSAGLAHLYLRLYRATGEERLAEAARHWFHWTFEFRDRILQEGEEKGIGGFPAWSVDYAQSDLELQWRKDPGFLTGAAGVGLALLAATTAVDPGWDRVLGASLPLAPNPG